MNPFVDFNRRRFWQKIIELNEEKIEKIQTSNQDKNWRDHVTGKSENDDEYIERLLSLVNSRRKNENGAKNGDLVLTIEDLLPNRKR